MFHSSEGPARSAVYYRSGTSRRGLASSSNRRGVVSDSETSRVSQCGLIHVCVRPILSVNPIHVNGELACIYNCMMAS